LKKIHKPTTFSSYIWIADKTHKKIILKHQAKFVCFVFFFNQKASSKMALLTVYFCSSRKLKIVLKQKPFGKILGFSQFHFILLKQKPFGNFLKILRFP